MSFCINEEAVKQRFSDYVSDYDVTNPKIKLKIDHTFRVAEISREIAKSLKLGEEDISLAWLIGMLHDVGRFEQVKKYNTFIDAESENHAHLGCDILFGEGEIRNYIKDSSKDELIRTAIYYHSDYRLPENLDDRTGMFANILRDADKIDIIRVQIDTPLEDIYNVTTAELKNDIVSEQVMKAFYEKHAVLRSIKKTSVDNVVGHISLIFELVYPKSLQIVKEEGYIYTLMNFSSYREETQCQFMAIREFMDEFLNNTKPL